MQCAATELDQMEPAAAEWSIRARPMVVRSHGLSDRGRRRESNEDRFVIGRLTNGLSVQGNEPAAEVHSAEQGRLFLVADGMGGHRAGERASSLASQVVCEFVLNAFPRFAHCFGSWERAVLSGLQTAVRCADHCVLDEAGHDDAWQGMGTTLTIALSIGSQLFVAHAGDSRCYLFRDGELRQLTRDHTLVQDMVEEGSLAVEDVRRHPLRSVVMNVVGGPEAGVRPDAFSVNLRSGDVMLLCSDGLTEMVPDDDIADLLRDQDDPRRACEQLVEAANQAGGADNVTVIAACYDRLEADSPDTQPDFNTLAACDTQPLLHG